MLAYTVAGAVFIIIGSCLIAAATSIHPPDDIPDPATIRKAFKMDRQRANLSGAGIAILTSGALLLLGFAATMAYATRLHCHWKKPRSKIQPRL